VITTDLGHLDGIAYIAKAGAEIGKFWRSIVKAAGLEDMIRRRTSRSLRPGVSRHAAGHGDVRDPSGEFMSEPILPIAGRPTPTSPGSPRDGWTTLRARQQRVSYSFFDTAVNELLIKSSVLDIRHSAVIGFVVETQCRFFADGIPGSIDVGVRVAASARAAYATDRDLQERRRDTGRARMLRPRLR
jgi:hypothetical protein